MELSLRLIHSISVMFLMILTGAALFKGSVVGNKAVGVISKVHLYVSAPAATLGHTATAVSQFAVLFNFHAVIRQIAVIV